MSTLGSQGVANVAAQVLSMDVDPETESEYRVLVGDGVKYVLVRPGTFEEDILTFPPLLREHLQPFPPGEWTRMTIERRESESLKRSIRTEPMAAVTAVWHTQKIDVLTLRRLNGYTPCTLETDWFGKKAVAKIARFDFEIPQMKRETKLYQVLNASDSEHHGGISFAPAFLGHLTENG